MNFARPGANTSRNHSFRSGTSEHESPPTTLFTERRTIEQLEMAAKQSPTPFNHPNTVVGHLSTTARVGQEQSASRLPETKTRKEPQMEILGGMTERASTSHNLNEETKGLKGFDKQNKKAAFALNINVDSIDSP